MKILVPFVVICIIASGSSLPTFPNIEYLGMGYNLIIGNPGGASSQQLSDPGWTVTPVIELTYFENKTTGDNRYLLPDQASAVPSISCEFASDAYVESSVQNYQSTLELDVSISAGYNDFLSKAAFSASAGYQQAQQTITQETNVLVSSKAICQTYLAKLLTFYPLPNVTHNFRVGVSRLPTDNSSYSMGIYHDFINTFGTHYSTSINMGAKAIIQYVLSSSSYQNLQSQGVNIQVGAQLSFMGFYGAVEASGSYGYSDYQAFQQSGYSQTIFGIGSPPPITQDATSWEQWESQINDSPVPMQYVLQTIASLLNADLFPDDSDIEIKQSLLMSALETYCGTVPNCAIPPPPTTPSNWMMFQANLQRTGQSSVVGPTSCNILWKTITGGAVTGSPIVGPDGTVYVGSDDAYVYALDGSNGAVKWKYQTGNAIDSSPTLSSNGTIYVGSLDTYLYSLDAADGSLKWRSQIGGVFQSSPAIGSDGTIYVASDFDLYALDGDNGTIKWSASGSASPAIGQDGTIYIGGDAMSAINPINGIVKWDYYFTSGNIATSPAIGSDGTVYVGCGDSYLYAFDRGGTLKWRYQTGNSILYSPAVGSDNTVYVGSLDTYLYAFYGASGILKWKYQTPSDATLAPAIGGDGTIYVSSGSFLALDGASGTLKWQHMVNMGSSPAIGSNGVIYLGGDDSYVYAFGNQGAPCS